MAFRPGLVSVTFRSLTVREVIRISVSCGLEAIEWGGDIHVRHGDIRLAREVGKATVEAGLKVAAYGSYYRAGESEEAGLSFTAICDTAAALEAPTIRIWAGVKNAEDATAEYRSRVIEDICRVGALAREAGLTVSLEFHGGTLTNTAESTFELLRATPAEQVRTYWQPTVGAPLPTAMEGLRKLLPWLSNVHVFHWLPDVKDRQPLATGRDRWQQYFQIIRAENLDGWALLEFVRGDSPDQLTADARTLRELLGE